MTTSRDESHLYDLTETRKGKARALYEMENFLPTWLGGAELRCPALAGQVAGSNPEEEICNE